MFRELNRRERTKLNSLFSYWNIFDQFKDKEFLIKDKEIFLINNKEFIIRNNPISAGIKVCKVSKHLHPSLEILQLFVDNNASRIVMINDHAEQLFLYGRDIFGSSIIMHDNFNTGDEVIIINKYKDALGLGRAMYASNNIKQDKVTITNLIDLGVYLREESYSEIEAKITKI
jgi:60S ribosome subunit biogenesis protein NIP7